MILSPIYQAIFDRLRADTGAGGLYNGGAWNLITGGAYAVYGSPNPVTGPYLVFDVAMGKDPTTTSDDFQCTVNMRIYQHIQANTSDDNISELMLKAMDRIHGDGMLQANRTPTYGFNRHLLVLPTNIYSAYGGGCLCTAYGCEIIDEHTVVGTVEIGFRISAPHST